MTGAAGKRIHVADHHSPDGDIAEDKVVTTAGSNSATATLTSSALGDADGDVLGGFRTGADGDECESPNSGTDGRWNGGDHHRNEFWGGRDGDVWRVRRRRMWWW